MENCELKYAECPKSPRAGGTSVTRLSRSYGTRNLKSMEKMIQYLFISLFHMF